MPHERKLEEEIVRRIEADRKLVAEELDRRQGEGETEAEEQGSTPAPSEKQRAVFDAIDQLRARAMSDGISFQDIAALSYAVSANRAHLAREGAIEPAAERDALDLLPDPAKWIPPHQQAAAIREHRRKVPRLGSDELSQLGPRHQAQALLDQYHLLYAASADADCAELVRAIKEAASALSGSLEIAQAEQRSGRDHPSRQ